jgi:HemY protein
MIRLLGWGLFVFAGALLAVWALSHQGYVAVHWSGFLVETSVSFLVLVLIFAAAISYGVVRIIAGIWHLPKRLQQWHQAKQAQLPVKQLAASMQALALNHGDAFMEKLVQGKDDSQWLRFMLAAQLAQMQQQYQQRDQLINKALAVAPTEAFTIKLLQARWLLDSHAEQALAIVDELLVLYPKQRTLKALKVQALANLGQWQALAAYLPTAKNALSRASYLGLQLQQIEAQLMACDDRAQLDQVWQGLTRQQQRQPIVAQAYVRRALTWGSAAHLWDCLANALDAHWDNRLLPLMAEVMGSDLYRELKQVQQWQLRHPQEAGLWWLAGLLARQQGLTALAEQSLKHSLALAPSVQAALALSDIYAQQAQPEAARLLLTEQLKASTL